jgi:carboxymethylenebutenolidase
MNTLVELGSVQAYVAKPSESGPFPALIVIHEWWGLDEQTKSIADRFAGVGYLVAAPDLYHGERAELGNGEKACLLARKYGPTVPTDLEMLYDTLKSDPDCTGKIGSVGFCFGGRMSLALGLSRSLDAVCTFYGGGMQLLFGQMQKLRSPVLGLFGDKDQSIPAGTIEEFDKLLDQLGLEHEVIMYPNSGHAFFRDRDPNTYRPAAAKDAWERVTKFFEKHLK